MMQDYSVNDIILNKEQSESLIDNILHPQDEVLDRRDTFLVEVQIGIWQHHAESSFSVELPNLDLSFVNSSETEQCEIIQLLEFGLK